MSKDILTRFMKMVRLNPKTGCWEWQASKTCGYGMFSINSKMIRAHRWIWEHIKGKTIPKDYWVYHICHNRACVNPQHLYISSKKDIYRNRFRNG